MAVVRFTAHLRSLLTHPEYQVEGASLHDALEAVFQACPRARGYILDDQGTVRKHVAIFIDGDAISDRRRLSDPLDEASEVYVMQALSGG